MTEERISRGRRAQAEFRELERAFQMVSDKLGREMLACEPGLESDQILAKHAQIRALGDVRRAMQAIIQDGLMAQREQELGAD